MLTFVNLFQYVLGELGIEALAYAQNSVHSFIHLLLMFSDRKLH